MSFEKTEAPPPKGLLPELWQLLIECRDEKDQERFTANCKTEVTDAAR